VGSEEALHTIEPNRDEAAAVAEALGLPVVPAAHHVGKGSKLVHVRTASDANVGPSGESEADVKVNGNNGSNEAIAET
jgi:hypothetical protein